MKFYEMVDLAGENNERFRFLVRCKRMTVR